jgi:uncharacterized protein (DUF302 family)
MTTKQIDVQRFSVTSAKSFEEVMAGLEASIGHPDMNAFRRDVSTAKTYAELEKVIHKVIGSSGLMEFTRFDLGEILRKERGKEAPKSLRLVAGNPLIMKQMVERVPDAGSYAPVTILIDERPDGVHLSYDRMASFLGSYGSPEALKVAWELDAKVEGLLTAAAK